MESKIIDLKGLYPLKISSNYILINDQIYIILLKGPLIILYNLDEELIVQKYLDEKKEELFTCALFYKMKIVAGSERGLIKIIDIKNGGVEILRRHGGPVNQIVMWENILYSISDDSSVITWDLDKMKEINKFIANQDLGLTLDISNCGRLIASGGSDNTVRIFDGGHFTIFQSNEIFPSPIEKIFFYGNFLCIKGHNNIITVIKPYFSKKLYNIKESQMLFISQFKNKVIYDFIVEDKIYIACENKIYAGYVYKNELMTEYKCNIRNIRHILKIRTKLLILGNDKLEIIKI